MVGEGRECLMRDDFVYTCEAITRNRYFETKQKQQASGSRGTVHL